METMDDILSRYEPIDYRNWAEGDSARRAINLKRLKLLLPGEAIIFDNAAPYNDARDDAGHAEITAYFAIKLLKHNKKGTRSVAVPAAILHDAGWYFGEADAWKKLVRAGGDTESEAVRRPHQNRGVFLAGLILGRLNYSEQYVAEIADIIGDHDTRRLPTTASGQIVRDADLLWRVTHPCLKAYFGDTAPEEAMEKMEKTALTKPVPFDLGTVAMSIGRIELVNTMIHQFNNRCHDLLREKGYQRELTKLGSFYQRF